MLQTRMNLGSKYIAGEMGKLCGKASFEVNLGEILRMFQEDKVNGYF
jgi:hypothetical protein